MNQNDYQKWVEAVRQSQIERERIDRKVRCIRVNNDRYAKNATFDDRLTEDDRPLVKQMGIAF